MNEITCEDIKALLFEASAAKDPETVWDCSCALRGDSAAWARCEEIIRDARAMDDEGGEP
jgi:hypothetical protein